jgi:predicted CopG family antitoxin
MSRRINIMVEDNVWENLREIAKGERSKFINDAIRDRFLKLQRQKAVEAVDKIRNTLQLKPVEVDVVDVLRRERQRDS